MFVSKTSRFPFKNQTCDVESYLWITLYNSMLVDKVCPYKCYAFFFPNLPGKSLVGVRPFRWVTFCMVVNTKTIAMLFENPLSLILKSELSERFKITFGNTVIEQSSVMVPKRYIREMPESADHNKEPVALHSLTRRQPFVCCLFF